MLYDKIGPGPHPCHWCGHALGWLPVDDQRPLCTDHLDDDTRNNVPANLVPSCRGCNGMRSRRVGDDELFVVLNGKRNRATERLCQHCQGPFLIATTALIRPNAGKFCSRSCRAKATLRGTNGGRPRVGDDELFVVRGGARHRATERTCQHCGGSFLMALSVLKYEPNKGRFCSRSCGAKARWAKLPE